MPRPITISIDYTKIDKELLKNGKYLNLAVWPNKNGADEWGNTHYCAQEATKEQREQGKRGPIVGNAKVPNDDAPPRRAPVSQPKPQRQPIDDDQDVPF